MVKKFNWKKYKIEPFTLISFMLFLVFVIPFFIHKWASLLPFRLHFCNHFACLVYSFIWLTLAIVGWLYLTKKKGQVRKKTRKALIITASVVLFVGIALMNITYCDSSGGIHFSDISNWFIGMSQLSSSNEDMSEDGCEPGVDCPVPTPPCIDTDDGHDYISYGEIRSGLDIGDKCMTGDVLRERFCSSILTYSSEDITCSEVVGPLYSCEDGECVLGVGDDVAEDDGEDETETNCGDGLDNDGDGVFDCADSDCATICGDFEYSCQHISPYPQCGGTCPVNEKCVTYYAGDGTLDGGWCECAPEEETPCGSSEPECGGWCLEGDICVSDAFGCFCTFNCFETDAGHDPLFPGTTTLLPVSLTDSCIFKTDRLIEYSCGDGIIISEEVGCDDFPGFTCHEGDTGDWCGPGAP